MHIFELIKGSEVSVIPVISADKQHSHDSLTLTAVNNTNICTYGRHSLTLNLGLRRSSDFIRHYGLMFDMQHRKHVDTHTPHSTGSVLCSVLSVLCVEHREH